MFTPKTLTPLPYIRNQQCKWSKEKKTTTTIKTNQGNFMLHAVSAIPSMPKPLHVPMDKGRAGTLILEKPHIGHRTWDNTPTPGQNKL